MCAMYACAASSSMSLVFPRGASDPLLRGGFVVAFDTKTRPRRRRSACASTATSTRGATASTCSTTCRSPHSSTTASSASTAACRPRCVIHRRPRHHLRHHLRPRRPVARGAAVSALWRRQRRRRPGENKPPTRLFERTKNTNPRRPRPVRAPSVVVRFDVVEGRAVDAIDRSIDRARPTRRSRAALHTHAPSVRARRNPRREGPTDGVAEPLARVPTRVAQDPRVVRGEATPRSTTDATARHARLLPRLSRLSAFRVARGPLPSPSVAHSRALLRARHSRRSCATDGRTRDARRCPARADPNAMDDGDRAPTPMAMARADGDGARRRRRRWRAPICRRRRWTAMMARSARSTRSARSSACRRSRCRRVVVSFPHACPVVDAWF